MLGNPIRDRRSERREATRREILDAAWDVVRREGLAALSLRDVARTVGMQAPSLYSYFDSKHAIYDAMFEEGARQALEHRRQLEFTGDAVAWLRAAAKGFMDFCVQDPARYQLLFQRTIPGFEPSPAAYAPAVEMLETLGAHFAEMGITEPAHVDLWTALMTGLVDQQISNDPGGDRWSRLVDDAVDMFVAKAKPKRKARR